MKKYLFALILSIIFVFNYTTPGEPAEASDKIPANKILSDKILNELDGNDFVKAYDLLENEFKNPKISQKELDQKVIAILIKIHKDKNPIRRSSSKKNYLPSKLNELNKKEKKLAKQSPSQAATYYKASKDALSKSQSWYISSVLEDGNGDAFRHAYWNALLTKRFSIGAKYTNVTTGYKTAKKWTDAHEETPKTKKEKLANSMDLNNNKVGRDTAKKAYETNTSKYKLTTGGGFGSDSSLAKTIKSKVDKGHLKRIVKGKHVKTNSSGKTANGKKSK